MYNILQSNVFFYILVYYIFIGVNGINLPKKNKNIYTK